MFAHRIDKQDLKPGDHVCTRRHGLLYTHHGVYMGEDKVIHYSDADGFGQKRDARVTETTLTEFLRGDPLRRVWHRRPLPSNVIVDRARELLDEAEYSLTWNNCEHFASYCVTGRRKSYQVWAAITSATTAVLVTVTTMQLAKRLRMRGTKS